MKCFFEENTSVVLSRTGRFLAAEGTVPGIRVPRAGALSALPSPSWVPAQPFPHAGRCWLFSLAAGPLGICFSKEVRWEEEDNRMLGFFLAAAGETLSPLARRAVGDWEQSYSAGECFHPL